MLRVDNQREMPKTARYSKRGRTDQYTLYGGDAKRGSEVGVRLADRTLNNPYESAVENESMPTPRVPHYTPPLMPVLTINRGRGVRTGDPRSHGILAVHEGKRVREYDVRC